MGFYLAPLQHFLHVHKPPQHPIFHPQHRSFPLENRIIFCILPLYYSIYQYFKHFNSSPLFSPVIEHFLSSFLRLTRGPISFFPIPVRFRHLACHCVPEFIRTWAHSSLPSHFSENKRIFAFSCFAHLTLLSYFTTSSQGNLGVEVYGDIILMSWNQYSVCVVAKSLEDFNTCSKPR